MGGGFTTLLVIRDLDTEYGFKHWSDLDNADMYINKFEMFQTIITTIL